MNEHSQERLPKAFHHALSLYQQKNMQAARQQCEYILSINPDHPDALHLLGVIISHIGPLDQAIDYIQQAIKIHDESTYHDSLAIFLARSGALEQAIVHYKKALIKQPDNPGIYNNMGMALLAHKKFDQSVAAFNKALTLKPGYHEARVHLSMAYEKQNKIDDAILCCQDVISMSANSLVLAMAYNQLGNIYMKIAQLGDAIFAYTRAVHYNPGNGQISSNFLMALNYDSSIIPIQIFQVHCELGKNFARSPTLSKNHIKSNQPIRVGYLSPDFRMHPVTFFIEPVLKYHQSVSVYCYADVQQPDSVTTRLASYDNTWRHISGYCDDAVVQLIQADQIDILVDLAGHTAKNRLPVFAQKPAPLQMSYLGYPNTTGLQAMDFRLTDAFADPVHADQFYTEKLIRIDPCFCCYNPPEIDIKPSNLPAQTNKFLSFGVFHNLIKVPQKIWQLWASILQRIPESRMIIQSVSLSEKKCKNQLQKYFQDNGVAPERVTYFSYQSFENYLKNHNQVDILLDTHPWSGHTVACHSLWMSTPVLSIAGNRYAGRMVSSILNTIGMDQWICQSHAEYLEKAIYWSKQPDQLSRLCEKIRPSMLQSPFCDAPRFTHQLEMIYEKIMQ